MKVTSSPMAWIKRVQLRRRLKRLVNMSVSWSREREGRVSLRSVAGSGRGSRDTDQVRRVRLEKMSARMKKSLPAVPEIEPAAALAQHEENKSVFVDVRSREEREVSIIPGALDEEQLLSESSRYRDRELVVYCTIGYRSAKFIDRQHEHFPRMTNMRGGILGWLHAGGKVVNGGQTVRTVHVYGPKWALQPEAYTAVCKK